MKNKMKDISIIFQINNLDEFVEEIKQKTFKLYLSMYEYWDDFIYVHDESKLTDKVVLFWVSQFTITSGDGSNTIGMIEYEELLKNVYKEYCQIMMNKLVDSGYLSLVWDNKKKIVYWKKLV